MPRPAQSEEQRDQVRRTILDAAQDLFDKGGIDGVSMRSVGARVGLTASALYAYFPAKIDLLHALWRNSLEELYGRLLALSRQEPDPVAAVTALGGAYAQFALANPARFRVLFMLDRGGLATELQADDELRQACYRVVRERVAEAIGQGRLRVVDADLALQVLWSGIHGVLNLTTSASSFPFLPPALLATTMIDTLLAGIQVEPSQAGS